MPSIFGLPVELLNNILLELERESLKEFRCVCRESRVRVTPILFDKVYFNFDLGGTGGLVNISCEPRLAAHVKTIESQRRSGLKKLDDFQMSHDATIYEYEPFVPDDNDGESQNVTEARRTIREFDAAVERLPNVTSFYHYPTYHYDRWGERWRQIQFHRDALILGPGYEDDVDADALQLFVAMQGIMLHAKPVRNVAFRTRGCAFWSATHLRRLLDWTDDWLTRWTTEEHLEVGIEGWLDRIGGPLAACRYIESATRYLARLESSFSCLESLECHVDTDGLGNSDSETYSVSTAVSRMLGSRRAYPSSPPYLKFGTKAPAFSGFAVISVGCIGFGNVIRGARHYAGFRSVADIGPDCRYGRATLVRTPVPTSLVAPPRAKIQDVVGGYPRLLLQPDAPIWNSGAATHLDYPRYESAIVDYVLRRSTSLPAIHPAEFLRQQVR
ncbi:hypothetical protein MBLNU13_g08912t3 [Cladosporium sp. NU13]